MVSANSRTVLRRYPEGSPFLNCSRKQDKIYLPPLMQNPLPTWQGIFTFYVAGECFIYYLKFWFCHAFVKNLFYIYNK